MRSIAQASGALKELVRLLPDVAVRLIDGGQEEVPVSALKEGDRLLVRPGAKIPADGIVFDGSSAVNESSPCAMTSCEFVYSGGPSSRQVLLEAST